jgi:putative ABC transport system substrate-binding protein
MKKAGVLSILVVVVQLAVAVTAQAQQPKKVSRIGYLSSGDPTSESSRFEAIRLALRDRGYIEGQNIATEYRYAEGKPDQLPELAAELVRLKVDIIVVAGGDGLIRAAKNATKTIPIVMVRLGSILSRQAWFKALPVPAATSRALQTLAES